MFVFITKKTSVLCLWYASILFCLLLLASVLPEQFIWLTFGDRKPSDLPPVDQDCPPNPLHPQVGSLGDFHKSFTALILCLKKNGGMLLSECVL